MPLTLSADEFAKKYGTGAGPTAGPITLSADEFQAKYGGNVGSTAAADVAARRINPPATARGDPNAASTDPTQNAGPVRRFIQGAGIPTSVAEMQQVAEADSLDPGTQLARGNVAGLAGPVGLAAQSLVQTVGRGIGDQAGQAIDAAQHGDVHGWARHTMGAAIPLVGPQLAEGNVAGALGTVASLVAPELASRRMQATAATRAATDAAHTAPLTESIGSRLAGVNETGANVSTEPRTLPPIDEGPQLAARGGKIFSPQEPITVPKFKSAKAQQSQLEAIAEKYPNASVYSDGDNFRIEANRPKPPKPAAIPAEPAPAEPIPADAVPAAATGQHGGYGLVGMVMRHPIAALAGGAVGGAMGHPYMGAEAGILAAESVQKMIQSPLWKAASSSVKSAVGTAIRAQDFGTVSAVASRVLDGQGLEDDYGHDQALYGLIQSLPPELQSNPQALNQELQQYDAVYVGPDGNAVQVPYHVQQQTVKKMTTGR